VASRLWLSLNSTVRQKKGRDIPAVR